MTALRRAWYHATDGGRHGAAFLVAWSLGSGAMLLLAIGVFLALEPLP